jgi:hypothetical protein
MPRGVQQWSIVLHFACIRLNESIQRDRRDAKIDGKQRAARPYGGLTPTSVITLRLPTCCSRSTRHPGFQTRIAWTSPFLIRACATIHLEPTTRSRPAQRSPRAHPRCSTKEVHCSTCSLGFRYILASRYSHSSTFSLESKYSPASTCIHVSNV